VHVLFAHGLESGPWGRKSLALRDAGHRVQAPDCRGLDLDARIAVVLDAMRSADPVPVVVGSSFGGIAALVAVVAAAREGIAVPGLVLCAPALALPPPPRWSFALDPPCPTIVLHGTRDEVVPIEHSRALARHPGVELVELDDDHGLAASVPALLAAVERLASAAIPAPSGLGRKFEALVAMLGHDLRNPLGTIQLTAELAQSSSADPRAIRHSRRIVDNVSRVVGVLEQAQLYSALLARGDELVRPAALDAAAVVASALEALPPQDRDRVELAQVGDATGRWDPDLLPRLVGEIVDNALAYRSDDGPVRVAIDGTAAGELVLTIVNAGAIPATQMADLFVPFASRKLPRPHGVRRLGLGLVLVRRWVELHRGLLAIDSSEDTTIVRVTLPRSA